MRHYKALPMVMVLNWLTPHPMPISNYLHKVQSAELPAPGFQGREGNYVGFFWEKQTNMGAELLSKCYFEHGVQREEVSPEGIINIYYCIWVHGEHCLDLAQLCVAIVWPHSSP